MPDLGLGKSAPRRCLVVSKKKEKKKAMHCKSRILQRPLPQLLEYLETEALKDIRVPMPCTEDLLYAGWGGEGLERCCVAHYTKVMSYEMK